MLCLRCVLDWSGWLGLTGMAICLNFGLGATAWIWLVVAPLLVWMASHPQRVLNLLFALLVADGL